MRSRRLLTLVPVVLLGLPACGGTPSGSGSPGAGTTGTGTSGGAGAVTVFAPGAFAETVKPIGAAYQKTGGTAKFEVGHTPMQLTQLQQGATPDVWISASPATMETAKQQHLVLADKAKPLAVTKIVVITAPGDPGKVKALTDLGRPGLRLLLGVPDLPIGKSTEASLKKMDAKFGAGFTKKVLANVVSRELGVKPIVSKVQLGEADAGIVFVTDAKSAPRVGTLDVPDALNTPVVLSIAPVTAGKNPQAAQAFVDFMTGEAGQGVLHDQGYLPPGK